MFSEQAGRGLGARERFVGRAIFVVAADSSVFNLACEGVNGLCRTASL